MFFSCKADVLFRPTMVSAIALANQSSGSTFLSEANHFFKEPHLSNTNTDGRTVRPVQRACQEIWLAEARRASAVSWPVLAAPRHGPPATWTGLNVFRIKGWDFDSVQHSCWRFLVVPQLPHTLYASQTGLLCFCSVTHIFSWKWLNSFTGSLQSAPIWAALHPLVTHLFLVVVRALQSPCV